MAMLEFWRKFGNSSLCACAVKIWPKILVSAYQSPNYLYLRRYLGGRIQKRLLNCWCAVWCILGLVVKARNDLRGVGRLLSCNTSQLPPFPVYIILDTMYMCSGQTHWSCQRHVETDGTAAPNCWRDKSTDDTIRHAYRLGGVGISPPMFPSDVPQATTIWTKNPW